MRHTRDIFSIFFNIKVCCVLLLESPRQGDSNENTQYTVGFQWLEHQWLVYHGYFEHVLESLTKNTILADITVYGIFRVIIFLY